MAGLGAYHWLIYTPHENLPHAWTLLDRVLNAGVAGAILFAGLLIGLRCLTWLGGWSQFNRLELVALACGLGLGVQGLAVLALGMLHLYYSVTFAVLLVTVPWLFPAERRWVSQALHEYGATARRLVLRRGRALQNAAIAVFPAGMSLSILSIVALLDLTMPAVSTGYDTYQYHWSVPLLLLRSHSMQGFPGWAHANLPFTTELLNLIALSLQAPEAALLVQDSFLVLTAVLIYSMVRRHFDIVAGWVTVLALLTVPLMIMFSTQAYAETALIFYSLAALIVLIHWFRATADSEQLGYQLPILAGLFMGFALSTKYQAIEVLPGATVCLLSRPLVSAWRQRGQTTLRSALKRAFACVVAFGGALGLALGPWLVKNWILLGDPVYPALGNIFATPLWNDVRDRILESTFAHFGPHAGVVWRYHLFALDLFLHPSPYAEGLVLPPGWVAFGAVISIPFVGLQLYRYRLAMRGSARDQILVVAFLALSTLLGFGVWSASGALVERYALPSIMLATVLGAMLLGWLIARLPGRLMLVSWLMVILVSVSCYVQAAPYLHYSFLLRSPVALLTGQASEQTTLRASFSDGTGQAFWQMVDYVNGVLPHNEKLLMLGRGTGYFFEDRAYVADSGGDWVPYLVSAGKTPDGILRLLQAQGFTYVVYDADLMTWLTQTYENHVLASYVPAYLAFQQQMLIPVAQWGGISLYRVPPPGAAAQALLWHVRPDRSTTDAGRSSRQ